MITLLLLTLHLTTPMPSIDWANTSPKDIAAYLHSYHQTSAVAGARPCPSLALDLCPIKHDCMIVRATCEDPNSCQSSDKIKCIPQDKFTVHLKAQRDADIKTTELTPTTLPLSTIPSENACHGADPQKSKNIDQLVTIDSTVHRLHISKNQRTFPETVAYCDALGLQIPVPTNKESFEFWSTVLNVAGEYYLGLSDGTREGHWLNVNDDTPINFTVWALHEPNNKKQSEHNAKLNCDAEYVDIPANIRLTSVCVGTALNPETVQTAKTNKPEANCVYFPHHTAYRCHNWDSNTLIQELKYAASVAEAKQNRSMSPRRATTKLDNLLHEENWSTYTGANITFFQKLWQRAERKHPHVEPLTSILFRPCLADHIRGINLFLESVLDDNVDQPITVILSRMFVRCLGQTPPTKLRRSIMVSVLKHMSTKLATDKAKDVIAQFVNTLRHHTPLVHPSVENLRVFSAVRRILERLHQTHFLESREFIQLQRKALLSNTPSEPVDQIIEHYALQLDNRGPELLKHVAELLII